MDPIRNPFAPGAGTRSPELSGRANTLYSMGIALQRVRRGLPAKSVVLAGLRGAGKTVLLDRMKKDAEAAGIHTLRIEAPGGKIASRHVGAPAQAFASSPFQDRKGQGPRTAGPPRPFGFRAGGQGRIRRHRSRLGPAARSRSGRQWRPRAGLLAFLEAVGAAARSADTALAMYVDELQYVKEEELAALITALHC